MPEGGPRNLPTVQRIPQPAALYLEWQLIDVFRIEIMSNIVITRSIIARQFTWQGGEYPAGGELEESAVGDFVQASAEGVIDLALKAMAEALHGGGLQAVVMAVRARG